MIVDANVVLRAYFPDEEQGKAQALIRDHVSGRLELIAPTLLEYEFTNAVVQAVRRRRITAEEGEAILGSFDGLAIQLEPVSWLCMFLWGELGCRGPASPFFTKERANRSPAHSGGAAGGKHRNRSFSMFPLTPGPLPQGGEGVRGGPGSKVQPYL